MNQNCHDKEVVSRITIIRSRPTSVITNYFWDHANLRIGRHYQVFHPFMYVQAENGRSYKLLALLGHTI